MARAVENGWLQPMLAAFGLVLALASPVVAQGLPSAKGTSSGLPIPRFVSLKSDMVNVRRGPAAEHQVAWVFRREGWPVEIVAEYDNWRRIRDADGAEGWVFHSLLSGRRTALVAPWQPGEIHDLHARGTADARITARLEAGVLANVSVCRGEWCRISGSGFDGWIEQEKLWGVYPGETFD